MTTNTDPEAIAREILRLVGEALEAERIRCTRHAERDAARRDAAYLDLRAQLDAVRSKLVESETWRTELRQEMDAVRGQLRDVKAQRDELREAAEDFHYLHGDGVNCWPRLEAAIKAAR